MSGRFSFASTQDFNQIYPTQICNTAQSELNDDPLWNIAFLAGGNNPNKGGQYEGGDITLGASNEIFGTLLAGNHFDTAGDTAIHGYICAVATHVGTGTNDLGGKTSFQ